MCAGVRVCVAQYMTNAGFTCWIAHPQLALRWASEEQERGRAGEGGGEVTFCFVDFKRICLLDHRTTAATTTTKNAN